jgi:anti-anti-sigma factor
MSLIIRTRKVDGVVFFDLAGNLTEGDAIAQVREAIKTRMNDGDLQFVIDVRDVSWIDDCGLEELMRARRTIIDQGGNLKLINFNPPTGLPLRFN